MITLDLEGYKSIDWSTLQAALQTYYDVASTHGLTKKEVKLTGRPLAGIYFGYEREISENNLQTAHDEWLSVAAQYGFTKQSTQIKY